MAANLPIVALAAESSNPESVWTGIGHGLRARTLRRRVKGWEKISRYCMLATGSPWPRNVSVFLDFLHVLVQSAAPPSALKAMKFSLHFFERAGAVASSDKIADHSSITALIREYEATSGRLVAPTRKAPPTTVALLAAFEGVVVDLRRPTFDRLFAWYRCVRFWTSMRFDDHS